MKQETGLKTRWQGTGDIGSGHVAADDTLHFFARTRDHRRTLVKGTGFDLHAAPKGAAQILALSNFMQRETGSLLGCEQPDLIRLIDDTEHARMFGRQLART